MELPRDTPPVLVVVLDSASVRLLDELVAAGRLPVVAELRRLGRCGRLHGAPAECGTGHVTLFSGVDPGLHGLYNLFQWSPADQRIRFHDRLPHPEMLWARLARAGRRSLVVDPYESLPPVEVDGLWISGWEFTNRFVLQRASRPAGARRALSRRLKAGPSLEDFYGRPSAPWLLRAANVVSEAPRRLADLTTAALSRDRFDLVLVDFAALHVGGHHFWDLSQLSESELRRARATGLDTTLERLYVEVDRALERILAALPGSTVIVTSPVGMQANSSRSDLLPDMLRRVLGRTLGIGNASAQTGSWLSGLRTTVPLGLRRAVARATPGWLVRDQLARLYLRGVDWDRTPAFVLPGDYHGFLRLNVRGREQRGIVPSADAEPLLQELAAGIASFTNPDGSPAVEAVERMSKPYGWEDANDPFPDLVVRWSDNPALRVPGVTSAYHGDVRRKGAGTGRPGNHTDGAWVVLVPGEGHVCASRQQPTHADVATTVCALLGIECGALAGQPLVEAA